MDFSFAHAKHTMTQNNLRIRPNCYFQFHMCNYTLDFKLSLVIVQDSQSLAFNSFKLTTSQMGHFIGERERLAIAQTRREFRDMTCGMKIQNCADY